MIDFSGMKELTIDGVKLKELSVDGVKLWQSGRLPAGYTELEYIKTDGNGYIDTGVIPAVYPDGIRYVMDFKHTAWANVDGSGNIYARYWGCLSNGSNSGNFSVNPTAGIFRVYVGSDTPYRYNWVQVLNKRIFIDVFAVSTSPSDTTASLVMDGVEKLSKYGTYTSGAKPMPNESIYLFTSRGNHTTQSVIGECYSFSMSAKNGTLIRDFIPCKNLSNSGCSSM